MKDLTALKAKAEQARHSHAYFTIKRHYINEISGIQDLNVLINNK